MNQDIVLRNTSSVCPTCLVDIPAQVVESNGKVFLRKTCPTHGESECLLSEHAWYYGALDRYFFAVMKHAPKQRDYIIRITEKCNLQCPICLAAADSNASPKPSATADMSLHKLCRLMDAHPDGTLKIDLMSAEPTLCRDLPLFLQAIRSRGHISSLHTNGLRLLDKAYLLSLKKAGLDEVFLQMDGFDDQAYMRIRGAKLSAQKLQILKNLEEAEVATSLVMVIMPDCNEHEIGNVLEYAREHSFIREVMFLGTRALGFNRQDTNTLMPDQVIDLVEQQTEGLCPRIECLRFQKLYFSLLALLGVRKCLYVQHNLLVRDKGELRSISEYIDWNRVEPVLNDFVNVSTGWLSRLRWLTKLGQAIISPKSLRLLPDFLSLFIRLKFGWRLKQLPFRPLLVGYITACDPENVDRQIGQFCGKGELANDIGLNESGSVANIERERFWANFPKNDAQKKTKPEPGASSSASPTPEPTPLAAGAPANSDADSLTPCRCPIMAGEVDDKGRRVSAELGVRDNTVSKQELQNTAQSTKAAAKAQRLGRAPKASLQPIIHTEVIDEN